MLNMSLKLLLILAYTGILLEESSGYGVGQEGLPAGSHDNIQKFEKISREIASYKKVAKKIIDLAVHGAAQNQSYDRLALFTDKFGSRISGSDSLEKSIDFMINWFNNEGFDNVHGEEAKVPHWVRGEESATMLTPRNHPLPMLGLGTSVGTGPDGIKAEAIVVRTFDELDARASEVPGKIVIYNQEWVNYGVSCAYREQGASKAARYGAVAALIRSVTPLSIASPHTGMQTYDSDVKKIPAACITVEDAEMMWRMSRRGDAITIFLNMSAINLPEKISRNTVAEIKGSTYPEQVVLVSGHLDSWDVGQGAMDDGGGAFISWQALSLIKQLNLRPKRTLRVVLWTCEEFGTIGSKQYFEQHKAEISNMSLVMESDIGTFTPLGLDFQGNKAATRIMTKVMKLLQPINITLLNPTRVHGDIGPWLSAGVPGATLRNQNDRYFYFHHSNGDTMTVQDRVAMSLCTALWTVAAYVVADIDEMLPRDSGFYKTNGTLP